MSFRRIFWVISVNIYINKSRGLQKGVQEVNCSELETATVLYEMFEGAQKSEGCPIGCVMLEGVVPLDLEAPSSRL